VLRFGTTGLSEGVVRLGPLSAGCNGAGLRLVNSWKE
jgi:hypothetical protein